MQTSRRLLFIYQFLFGVDDNDCLSQEPSQQSHCKPTCMQKGQHHDGRIRPFWGKTRPFWFMSSVFCRTLVGRYDISVGTSQKYIQKEVTKRRKMKNHYVDGTHGYALISCLQKLMMIASTTFKVCLQLQFLTFFFLSWYLSLCPLTGCWLDKEYVHLTQSMTFVVKPTEKARAHQAYFKFIYMIYQQITG